MPTVYADIREGKIEVTSKDFNSRDMVALIPGAKWKTDHWELPLSYAVCKQLRYTFEEDLELGDDLIEWGYQEMYDRVTPCLMLRELLYSETAEDYDERLYGYQAAGADFLISAGSAILSDPPGAGKTCTAVSAARYLDALPALVVAPKSTLVSWGREIERWWPGVPIYIIDGDKRKRQERILEAIDNPGWVIINWESVWRHARLAAYGSMRLTEEQRTEKELNEVPFRLVIADEAHRMQNPKSIQTRAVWYLGDSRSCEHRWALTGTPLTNQIDTLWPILRFLDKNEWPSRVAFIDRYAVTRPIPWGNGTEVIGRNPHTVEEFDEIFQPRFRRMPKEVILPQLPPIQRTRRYLEMTSEQRRIYNTMSEDMLAVTEEGQLIIAANPAVKMMRMVQFSSASAEVTYDNDGDILARLRDPSNKLDALMDDLPDLLDAGESVIVFAVSRQLIEMAENRLQKKGIQYSVIKGNQNTTRRQMEIDSFQEGKTKICLVVIAAGGVGLTLTAGRIAIFLQRSWSFVENHQAEGRLHRIGSEIHEAIEIIDYVSQGTVDEVVIEVAEGKELKLEEIVRDREAVSRLLQGRIDE